MEVQHEVGPRFRWYRTFRLVPPPLPFTSSYPRFVVPKNSTMMMVSCRSCCPPRCRNFQMIDGYWCPGQSRPARSTMPTYSCNVSSLASAWFSCMRAMYESKGVSSALGSLGYRNSNFFFFFLLGTLIFYRKI